MKNLFFGGIHPKYNKEMSTKETSFRTISPKQVVIPMQQHIGNPCTPLVKVGDHVLWGQKIGDGEGLCVPVHASVSGTVVAIEQRPHPTLGQSLAVVIENDFQDTTADPNELPETADEILDTIRNAGVVGMGGAAFPGNVKALNSIGKVDTLIANACECEPYITADDSLMRTNPEQVLEGMMILCNILEPKRVVLAVEIEMAILPTRYPQGAEKQLIYALTGREVPPGQLPASVGCAVFNVSTFASIYRAVRFGMPLTQRIVTISGEAIVQPQNFIVRIGTSFQDLIEAAGGINDKTERVISGGPMMGIAQNDLSVPVVKATNSILCLMKDQNAAAQNPVCLRCGKCVSVCPMRLQPLYIYRFVKANRVDELERLNVNDCIECGCCSYTCPGKLSIAEQCRVGKKMLKEAGKK